MTVLGRRVAPRNLTMLISGILCLGLMLVMMFVPVPYAVRGPGPTFNTLGEVDSTPLITVDGAPSYEDDEGQLRLTTVVSGGGPGYPMTAGDVIQGWASRATTVIPAEVVYDPTVTQDALDEQAAEQMTTSQQNATVAALTELGYKVPVKLTVAGVAEGSGAEGVVSEGDVITAIAPPGGEAADVVSYDDMSDVLAETPPGSQVTLEVQRDGQEQDLEVTTADDGYGGSLLGVSLSPDFTMPVDVSIQIDNVGGPSAGTMFALGIIDTMTPGPLPGDHVVAGTGTMALTGRVGPIGGIVQKLHGALRDGAEYFLAPVDNCDEVAGNIPGDLQVFAISTLADARQAVEAIADGETSSLPTCG